MGGRGLGGFGGTWEHAAAERTHAHFFMQRYSHLGFTFRGTWGTWGKSGGGHGEKKHVAVERPYATHHHVQIEPLRVHF